MRPFMERQKVLDRPVRYSTNSRDYVPSVPYKQSIMPNYTHNSIPVSQQY